MGEYLPSIYQRFSTEYAEVMEAFERFAETTHSAGPLSSREQRLANLGIAVGCASEGGVRSHTRKALSEGIQPEAIRHVAVLAISTAGYPAAIAGYKWINEVLDKETPGRD
jgi:4-carboxymuconolactone decarboxylase